MRESSANPFKTTNRLGAAFLARFLREKASPELVKTQSFFGAKSLFRNILPVSPCDSRFCGDASQPLQDNPLRMNILGESSKRECSPPYPAKSLFWKILRVGPYGSRFYAGAAHLRTSKSFRMNILEKSTKKLCGGGRSLRSLRSRRLRGTTLGIANRSWH